MNLMSAMRLSCVKATELMDMMEFETLSFINNLQLKMHTSISYRNVDAEVSLFDTFFDSDGNWKKEQRHKEWHRDEGNLLDNVKFINVLQGCMSKPPNNCGTSLMHGAQMMNKVKEIAM